MKSLVSAILIVSFTSSVAIADCGILPNIDMCSDVRIEYIASNNSGTYIATSGSESKLNCASNNANGSDSQVEVFIARSSPAHDSWLAILLSAQAQNKPVDIVTVDDGSYCPVTLIFLKSEVP